MTETQWDELVEMWAKHMDNMALIMQGAGDDVPEHPVIRHLSEVGAAWHRFWKARRTTSL
jgi:uncharacterized protein (DUF736 family)